MQNTFSEKYKKYLPDLGTIRGLDLNWNHLFEGCNEDYPFPNVGVDSLYSIGGTGHNHLVYIPQLGQVPENYPIAIFNEEEGNAETIASSILTWFPSYLVFRVNKLLTNYVRQKNNSNQGYTNAELQGIHESAKEINNIVKVFDNQEFEAILPEIFTCIAQRDNEDILQKWDYVRFYRLAEKNSYFSQIVQIETKSPNDEHKLIAYNEQYPTINRSLNKLFYEYDIEYKYNKLRKSEKIAYITPEIAEKVLFSDITVDFGNTIETINVWFTCAEILENHPQYAGLQKLIKFILEEMYESVGETYFALAEQLAAPVSNTELNSKTEINNQNSIHWAMNAAKNAIYFYHLDTKEFYSPAFKLIQRIVNEKKDLNYGAYLQKMTII